MTVKSVRTEYVTENKLNALFAPEYRTDVEPHHICTINTDRGVFRGTGATEYEAEQDAIEKYRYNLGLDADKAIEEYNARNGYGMIHIA